MGGFLVPCVWRAAQLCPVQATTQPVLMSATSDQHERVKASSASLEEQNQRIQASARMAVQAENTAADVLESLRAQRASLERSKAQNEATNQHLEESERESYGRRVLH